MQEDYIMQTAIYTFPHLDCIQHYIHHPSSIIYKNDKSNGNLR